MAVLALALVGVSVGCHSSSSAESGGSEGVIDRSPEPAASGVRAPGTARGRQGPSRQEQVMVEDWDWGRDRSWTWTSPATHSSTSSGTRARA
jgi:hypothetical protein